jgi:hypothetical protein
MYSPKNKLAGHLSGKDALSSVPDASRSPVMGDGCTGREVMRQAQRFGPQAHGPIYEGDMAQDRRVRLRDG